MSRTARPFVPVIALLLCLLVPASAWADTGPKPSVTVSFEGLDDHVPCYATLLSKESSSGSAHAWDGDEPYAQDYAGPAKAIWQAFVDYQDPDGYYFLQEFWDVSDGQHLSWGYYPPSDFKLLLYFPKTGAFASSAPSETYAFHSHYSARVQLEGDVPTLELRRVFRLDGVTSRAIARMAFTLVVELVVALLFGYRSWRQLALIAAVNVVTQLLLTAFVAECSLAWIFGLGYAAALFIAELVILVAEAAVYLPLLGRLGAAKERTRGPFRLRPLAYACVANAASFGLGLLITLAAVFPADVF